MVVPVLTALGIFKPVFPKNAFLKKKINIAACMFNFKTISYSSFLPFTVFKAKSTTTFRHLENCQVIASHGACPKLHTAHTCACLFSS